MDVEEIAIDGRRNLVLMDNNFLAAGEYAKIQLEKIIRNNYRVDFNQGLDARLVDDAFAKLLAKVKGYDRRRIRFACDTKKQIVQCEKAIEKLIKYGFKGEFFIYTMIGGKNGLDECYERLHYWWQRNQEVMSQNLRIYPYAQPYRNPHQVSQDIPQWEKDMAQWCDKKQFFSIMDFKDFSPRKNFYCRDYFDDATAST